jgi:hypothetical protein
MRAIKSVVACSICGPRRKLEVACPIDEWRRRQPDLPSRSEAIRRLVELGLKVKSKWQDRLEFYRLVRLAELFLASFSTKGRLSPATEARR